MLVIKKHCTKAKYNVLLLTVMKLIHNGSSILLA